MGRYPILWPAAFITRRQRKDLPDIGARLSPRPSSAATAARSVVLVNMDLNTYYGQLVTTPGRAPTPGGEWPRSAELSMNEGKTNKGLILEAQALKTS